MANCKNCREPIESTLGIKCSFCVALDERMDDVRGNETAISEDEFFDFVKILGTRKQASEK